MDSLQSVPKVMASRILQDKAGRREDGGCIKTDRPLMTSLPGLFAGEDVRAESDKQAASTAGQ